ncbi:hypothetical protein Acr_01g0005220 [Actinidia rufa]|uniref:DUF6821 domain-containing protein n=1 Tax=Actinidia rufa TaxID=165716 RepID=A0A7J0E2G4_9ERIC|nr:hypothetical protein Acr_01g0005220 [Actinidia rufa]
MDLDEEWVILPDDGGKQISSRKYGLGGDPNIVFHTDYFIERNPKGPNRACCGGKMKRSKENTGDVRETDQQTVSQVFFNNMKMDSPKSLDSMIGSNMRMERENFNERNRLESDSEEKITWGGKNGGLNIWKWGLSGVGAIFSFLVWLLPQFALPFLEMESTRGTNSRINRFDFVSMPMKRPFNEGHIFILLEFRLCSSDMGDIRPEVLRHKFEVLQRIKEVVHHAAKLNEAMRGVPLTRAQFTYGGYYDAGL